METILVCAIESDGVAAPDVLWVQVGDVDVLYNDVGHAVDKAKTFAPDDTFIADTDDSLVASDEYGVQGSLIVSDRHFGIAGVAPVRSAV
jgi:hypothetical protein